MANIKYFRNKGHIGATPINAENLNANTQAFLEILGLNVDTYSNQKTYKESDLVIQNYKIYKCKENIVTPEVWNEEKWDFCALVELIFGKPNMQSFFPIGYIYISVNNVNPSEYFGGEWEQIKDVFLLACGNKHQNGATGGAENVTLNISQIPSHTHTSEPHIGWGSGVYTAGYGKTDNNSPGQLWPTDIGYTGEGQSHENMPPYLAVYMWKRVA